MVQINFLKQVTCGCGFPPSLIIRIAIIFESQFGVVVKGIRLETGDHELSFYLKA